MTLSRWRFRDGANDHRRERKVDMKRFFRVLLAVGLLGAVLVTAESGTASATDKTMYYVSMGDSVAGGAYPDKLAVLLQDRYPKLAVIKLGCPGESTTTMIQPFPYRPRYRDCQGHHPPPYGSQLDIAVSFLEAHKDSVALVTITIGAGDVLGTDGVFCWDPETGLFDQACVEGELPDVESNLADIIETLHGAAPGVPILGMTYYSPFLGYWVSRPGGQSLAQLDEEATEAFNAGLVSAYQSEGAIVADVADLEFFNIADFTDMVVTEEWGEIPVNVANACAWTLFCTVGDVHPNDTGHEVIAEAFEAALPA
jgi:lysophospholipase L1-like esterase